MVNASRILEESFELLIEEPKLFVPKLVSTVSASIFLVFLLSNRQSLAAANPGFLLVFLVGALIGISVLGVFSSMMLSAMVKQGSSSLAGGFSAVKDKIVNVVVASLAVIVASFAVSILVSLGYLFYLSTGSTLVLLFSALVFLVLVIFLGYVSYFLPVTLLENSFRNALSRSHQVSSENSKVVLALLGFSLVLITVAFVSTGFLEKLGYIGFVLGRIVSSVVNTYIFVVSPSYYVETEK